MGEDVEAKYRDQLAELRMNSKPVINLLTMMAEDYIKHAPIVVQVIENHLQRVRPEMKLPSLYLVDSIIKNVRKDYVNLFTQNIVSTFCGVFEKVDEKTRGLLWKLRGTWSDHFPHKKLYAIDLRCHQIDTKWPVQTAPPTSGSIHVNPRFLKPNTQALLNPEQILCQASAVTTATVAAPSLDSSASEVQMRAQLLAKQKELLELQTRKVELELLQTKLQIEEKSRRQKEDETTKQIDIATKQERTLLGMAEFAKNRTELIQQQLSHLHPKPSIPSSARVSKSQDALSDRDSHCTLPAKLVSKGYSEASGSSVDSNSSKKSKSSREKAKNDDRDRRDRSKSDKSRDRHDSKEKDSRHRHRDKDRHSESKDKEKNRSRDRIRETSSSSKSSGDWKDYNEAKRASPQKRSHKKEPGLGSDDDNVDSDTKLLKRAPSSPIQNNSKIPALMLVKQDEDGMSEENQEHGLSHPAKSPSFNSQAVESSGSECSSPMKRKFSKDKQSDREYSKTPRNEKERISKDKDKTVISDPRLRRRVEREKGVKAEEKNWEQSSSKEACKPTEWNNYRARQQAVLRKSYRKPSGNEHKDEETASTETVTNFSRVKPDLMAGDVDLRAPTFDVDLRTETDGSGPEPPNKKSRGDSRGTFDDLFGHQDVDLRGGCWTQVKHKGEDEGLLSQTVKGIDNELLRDTKVLRSPGPPSPTNSVISTTSSACDPLGRPLIYNRLPNDPEERKRSLDSRSTSIDAVDQFKSIHIDRVLRGNGILSDEDMKTICLKAKEEHDQGLLNADQYVALMKQIMQIGEASRMKEVQQLQMSGNSWQSHGSNNAAPNPWVTDNNIWNGFGSAPAAAIGTDFPVRFPGPTTPWETPKPTPWMAPPLPVAPAGPNPFEVAIARPQVMVDDYIPTAGKQDLRVAETDVGRTIPIDKVYRQIRFYRDAVIVMTGLNGDEPRDLTFQLDDIARTILINGKPLELFLGETKKFDLNRVTHSLKIGSPGRELCIDDKRYELFFGGRPKHINIDGRSHTFQFLPPSPQVAVGGVPRYDLCAGKVTLTIDATLNVSVFLDEKLQKIEIGGEPVVMRFAKGFQSVTLNGRAFPTNFGARLPFSITLPNSEKHYLRFNSVSPDIEHGIKTFLSANYGGDWNDGRPNVQFGGRGGRGAAVRGNLRGRGVGRGRRDNPIDTRLPGPNPWTPDTFPETAANTTSPLDILNSIFHAPTTPVQKKNNVLDQSYESERFVAEDDSKALEEKPKEAEGNLNVTDLVANLIKFGLLPSAAPTTTEAPSEEPVQEKEVEEESLNKGIDQNSNDQQIEPKEAVTEKNPKSTIPPLPTVDVTFDDNLKERRDIAIGQIWTGVQCSQCGLRFPPDQTLRYSQHLDWHFRQNRREKANARKALSRKWYYDLSDWIQFEEIEDLEERAASLFEHPDLVAENESRSPTALNPDDYTVLASCHEGAVCPQCGESFESFFDEEQEEWRLKNAKVDEYEGEKKLYHPICHQDYLRSLVEESIIHVEEEDEPMVDGGDNKENEIKEDEPEAEEEDDEVLIIREGKKEVVVMEVDIDDDDVEKNTSSVNFLVNDEDKSNNVINETKTDDNVTDKENYNSEKNVNNCSDNSSLDVNATRTSLVPSPILIDEDSTFLPGLCDEAEGGVFGFALGTGSQKEIPTDPGEEDKKIIYEPMKFDMPPIKLEPPDDPVQEEATTLPDDFMSNLQPFLASSGNKSPGGSEPMNIDLTEEDSTDAVDSGARLVTQIRTSIDGNLQHEDTATLPFIPAPKIRINLAGAFGSVSSEASKEKENPATPVDKHDSESSESQEHSLVKEDGSSNNILSNESEINKNNPDPVLSEDVNHLKPRLVGRKLTNCPPKFKGKEESGLCVIC